MTRDLRILLSGSPVTRHLNGGPIVRHLRITAAVLLALGTRAPASSAQEMLRLRDLTIDDTSVPIRVMGYGLVVGLDGSGDKVAGGKGGGMTVNSVVNLLKRFNVDVPVEVLKTKNVAAVLVTAEVPPFLRPGGRFEVQVSSAGDARSLRGGTLWMTPLVADVGGAPVATAQGSLLFSEPSARITGENSARMPSGGLLELALPHLAFGDDTHLWLREPDVTMASRIATAINREIGDGTAVIEDPGSIQLKLKPDKGEDHAALMARIGDLRVQPSRSARLVIDGRSGAIVSGGDITVGEASVTQGPMTLTIGAQDTSAVTPGQVRVTTGTSVNKIAEALRAVKTPQGQIAAIFESLRAAGAITAEIIVR